MFSSASNQCSIMKMCSIISDAKLFINLQMLFVKLNSGCFEPTGTKVCILFSVILITEIMKFHGKLCAVVLLKQKQYF